MNCPLKTSCNLISRSLGWCQMAYTVDTWKLTSKNTAFRKERSHIHTHGHSSNRLMETLGIISSHLKWWCVNWGQRWEIIKKYLLCVTYWARHPVGFGVGVRILHYSKAWLLLSRNLQSSQKQKNYWQIQIRLSYMLPHIGHRMTNVCYEREQCDV